MGKTRHPAQATQFEPEAALQFRKRRRLGLPGIDWVNPGDPVTAKIRKLLGPNGNHRLRMWFRAGILELADFQSKRDRRQALSDLT